MADATSKINSLYDKALTAQKAGIDAQYKQSISDQEYAKSQIDPTYRRASNDLATQYERNRRNLNMQAMVNGLNTGTGSQQQLALNNVWTRNYADLQGQRAQSIALADKAIADLKNQYQAAIAQATAENDYKRAAALLDDYYRNAGSRGGGYGGGWSGGGSQPPLKDPPEAFHSGGATVAEAQAGREAAIAASMRYNQQNPGNLAHLAGRVEDQLRSAGKESTYKVGNTTKVSQYAR